MRWLNGIFGPALSLANNVQHIAMHVQMILGVKGLFLVFIYIHVQAFDTKFILLPSQQLRLSALMHNAFLLRHWL
jgi:hypothetical protein